MHWPRSGSNYRTSLRTLGKFIPLSGQQPLASYMGLLIPKDFDTKNVSKAPKGCHSLSGDFSGTHIQGHWNKTVLSEETLLYILDFSEGFLLESKLYW